MVYASALWDQCGSGQIGSAGAHGLPQLAHKPQRLHFLDWLRSLMVVLVVFSHVFLTLSPLESSDYVLDDLGEASSLASRWISVARPWCLPMLFWVSGASCACVASRSVLAGLPKIIGITALGIGLNAAMWLLGPRDPVCSALLKCPGRGLVFPFSVVSNSGFIFPLVYQMWYTICLTIFTLLSWPLFKFLQDPDGCADWYVPAQWLATCITYAVAVQGSDSLKPYLLTLWLCFMEAVFLALATLTVQRYRPNGLPLRVLHYALAAVLVLQFGATTFSDTVSGLSASFVLYVFIGFKQFYVLGFVMTKPRADDCHDNVKPIISQAWPLMFLFYIIFSPSTNWMKAGNLTYPYFPNAIDRCMYISGGLVVIFAADRGSRLCHCARLPVTLNWAGLVLYIAHPVQLTLLVHFLGAPSPWLAWSLCILISVLGALIFKFKQEKAPKQ